MLYLLILTYILFLTIYYDVLGHTSARSFHYKVLWIVFVIVAGFSYRLGIDTVRYEEMFDSIAAFTFDDLFSGALFDVDIYAKEPMWLLINSICKSVFVEFYGVKLTVAFFVNSVIFWFIYNHSKYIFLSIFYYFVLQYWNYNFEVLRESIAIAFFLLGLHQILDGKKNLIAYYFFVLMAMLSHTFAFILLFVPLLHFTKIYNHLKVALCILAVLLFSANILLSHIPQWTLLLSASSKMEIYTTDGLVEHVSATLGGMLGVVLQLPLLFIILKKLKSTGYCQWLPYVVLSAMLLIASMQVIIINRFNNYLTIPVIVCLVEITYQILKNKFNMVLVFALISFVSINLYAKSQHSTYRRYTPYASVLTKSIDPDRERLYMKID